MSTQFEGCIDRQQQPRGIKQAHTGNQGLGSDLLPKPLNTHRGSVAEQRARNEHRGVARGEAPRHVLVVLRGQPKALPMGAETDRTAAAKRRGAQLPAVERNAAHATNSQPGDRSSTQSPGMKTWASISLVSTWQRQGAGHGSQSRCGASRKKSRLQRQKRLRVARGETVTAV